MDNEEFISFESELQELLSKYHIRIETTVEFPHYKILPEEVKLALIILNKHGGVIKPKYIKE